jgi:hypothetical protein
MVSPAQGLLMMQGGRDRTGLASLLDSVGTPGADIIAQRRSDAAEQEAMDEYERREAERLAELQALIGGTGVDENEIPPLGDPNRGSNPNVDQSQAGIYLDEEGNKRVMGDEFQSISGLDVALGIIDPVGTAFDVAGNAFKDMTEEEIDAFYRGPAQDQLYGGYGFDKFRDTYDLEEGDTNIFGNEVLMDSPMLVDPELRSLYEGAAGFEDGGRVGMFSGGIMNNLLGSPQVQSMIQQYRQPTMDFSQISIGGPDGPRTIPAPGGPGVSPPPPLTSATPPQAYTPFVSTMPLYDPSTRGTGLPSTAGMTDPYFVYDPYSPVGAFDAPPASTGPRPAGGFLTQKQIDETFKDMDKFTLAKQKEKADAAAKAKTQTKKGGGGEGYKAYQERMGKKGNGKVGGHTKSHKGVSQSDRETGKFSGGKQKGNKGPNQGGSIHG